MPSADSVELVVKLRDGIQQGSADATAVETTLRGLGVDFGQGGGSPDAYRTVIVPRDVASRAVEVLKGNAAVDGAFVKPRGETP